jgi:hypothetical protein
VLLSQAPRPKEGKPHLSAFPLVALLLFEAKRLSFRTMARIKNDVSFPQKDPVGLFFRSQDDLVLFQTVSSFPRGGFHGSGTCVSLKVHKRPPVGRKDKLRGDLRAVHIPPMSLVASGQRTGSAGAA